MGPPGGGRNAVDPRFVSLFNVYNLTAPSEATLKLIFSSILTARLANFNESVRSAAASCPGATLRLFSAALAKLPPTPSKFHYIFNLRDLSRVFEGCVLRRMYNLCLRMYPQYLSCACHHSIVGPCVDTSAGMHCGMCGLGVRWHQ